MTIEKKFEHDAIWYDWSKTDRASDFLETKKGTAEELVDLLIKQVTRDSFDPDGEYFPVIFQLPVKDFDPDALVELAEELRDKEFFEESLKLFKFILEGNPVDLDALSGLSLTFLANGEPNEAIKCCDKMININKESVDPYYTKAVALFNLERFEDAKQAIQVGLEIASDNNELTELLERINNPSYVSGSESEKSTPGEYLQLSLPGYRSPFTPSRSSLLKQTATPGSEKPLIRKLFATPKKNSAKKE